MQNINNDNIEPKMGDEIFYMSIRKDCIISIRFFRHQITKKLTLSIYYDINKTFQIECDEEKYREITRRLNSQSSLFLNI